MNTIVFAVPAWWRMNARAIVSSLFGPSPGIDNRTKRRSAGPLNNGGWMRPAIELPMMAESKAGSRTRPALDWTSPENAMSTV
jgi:hypothetical protein